MDSPNATTKMKPSDAILPTSSSVAQIEHIVRLCTSLLNAGDWTFSSPQGQLYRSHIAPNFTAQFDANEQILTFEDLWQDFLKWYYDHPGFRCEYTYLTTHVDEAAGMAVVHVELELSFPKTEMAQSAIGEIRARRDRRGEWMLEYYGGMRGMKGMSGYV